MAIVRRTMENIPREYGEVRVQAIGQVAGDILFIVIGNRAAFGSGWSLTADYCGEKSTCRV
jgi:hypothetical protein